LLSIKSKVKTRNIHKNLQKEFYIKGEVIKRYSSSCKLIYLTISSLRYSIIQPTHPFPKNAKEKLN